MAVVTSVLVSDATASLAAGATIELTSSQNPSDLGQAVTFTVKVASPDGWPTGEAEIFRGPNSSGPIALDPQGVMVDARGEAQMAIGLVHACAVTRAGAVRCWGGNEFGQLGDGTTEDRPAGVTVQGLESGAVAVAVGTRSSCALTSAGRVLCWGDNDFNQLGDDTTNDSLVPVQPQGLGSGVVDLFSSEVDVCALKDDGELFCWGLGNEGLLGNGTNGRAPVPAKVPGLPAVRYLPPSIHDAYSLCVVTTTDTVFCWGRNNVGQVGNGTDGEQVLSPVEATITGVDTVAVGNAHTCALKKDGSVACWGWNDFGQVGEGTPTTIKSTPVVVSALAADDVASVTVGGIHSCAVLTNGTAKCWGSNVGFALGAEGVQDEFVPEPQAVTVVPSGIVAMVGGEYASAAVKSGGRLYAWGINTVGRLGDGTAETRSTPVVVKPMLAPSLASVTHGDLPRGQTRMTALYAGTPEFDGVGGGVVVQIVKGAASTTSVTASKTQFTYGDDIALAVAVNAAGTPTGAVTFKADGVVLGTRSLDTLNGIAILQTTRIRAGSKALTAEYAGDAATEPSKSPPLPIAVSKAATTASLTASGAAVLPGQPLTLAATIAATTGAERPTGLVTFRSDDRILGTRTLSNGKASITTAIRTGTTGFSVVYGGNRDFNPASAAQVSVIASPVTGPELRINSRTTGVQDDPAIVGLAGPFAVVWESEGQDGSSFGIYGQRRAADGTRTGTEFRLNAFTPGAQTRPAVAALLSGRWVAVWESEGQDGSGAGLYGRIYEADGKAGPVFPVNAATAGNQRSPAVAGLANGSFVVAWTTDTVARMAAAVVVRRFNSTGAPLAPEKRVDTRTSGRSDQPAVAGLTNGGVVVAWRSVSVDLTSRITARRYSGSLAEVAAGFRVDTDVVRAKSSPDVAALEGGGFVIGWVSDGQDGSGSGVYGQRHAADGKRAGSEFRISATTRGEQTQPSLAGFPGGGFAAAWTTGGQDGSGSGVYLRRYDAAGDQADVTIRVNATTLRSQDEPDVATLGKRSFVVTWTSEGQDTSKGGVYAQRFRLGLDASQPLR